MATVDLAQAAKDPELMFAALSGKLNTATSEVKQRITAHIREVSGYTTLPAFHNNGATREEKCKVYGLCLKAMITGDYSLLKGDVPAGQAKTAEKPTPNQEAEKPQEQPEAQPETQTPQPGPKDNATATQRTGQPAPASDGTVEGAVRTLMALIGQQKAAPAAPPVDEAQVRQIVNGIVGERMKEIRSEAMSKVDEYLKNVPPREVLQIKKWDGTVTEIKERYHKQLPQIVKALSARNAMGWSEFLYVVGAPGAGKTHMLRQIGTALGIKHYPYPMGPTATEGRLLGFNNIANGSFVAGWIYPAYKDGGLVGLDEIDLADGSVLAATNSIENEEFTFGNGERVKRHKDFTLVAFANTIGTGATGGFVRNRLDAATLDRFTVIRLEYDEELEKSIYGNPKWAEYVQRVRKHVDHKMAGSLYVTPRATRKGAALIANGFTAEDAANMTLFRLCSKEQRDSILAAVGPFKG